MPFSIIGSTEEVQTFDGRTVKGRQYLWGVAEGESRYCFVSVITPALTSMIFETHS
jgi:septin family protein